MPKRLLLSLVVYAVCATTGVAQTSATETALLDGRLDESIAALRSTLRLHPEDGAANLLLCRALYAEEHETEAISACESAARLLPRSSSARDWLGRAYGMRASHAGPLAGFRLARQVRSAFESAVALDPRNPDAVNDLSEYYVGAPSIVGGGLDKAEALAARVEGLLPQSAHRIRGLIAENRKDNASAEREFRLATGVPDRVASAAAQADLGAFFGRTKQFEKAQAVLAAAISAAGTQVAAVDAASSLTDIHRLPDLSARTFSAYLRSSNKSDAEPAPRVHVLLGKLLAAKGDRAGAKIEFEHALSLASEYGPARQALQGLK